MLRLTGRRPLILSMILFAAFPLTVARAENAPLPFPLPATFQGILPCADCAPYRVTITLYSNGLYWLRSRQIGSSERPWGEDGDIEGWFYDKNAQILRLVPPPVGNPPCSDYNGDSYQVGAQPPTLRLVSQSCRKAPTPDERLTLVTLPSWSSHLQIDWWRVTQLLGKRLPNASKPGDIELGIRLDATDDTVYGSSGCNDFRGTFKGSESALRFEGLNAGTMLCAQDRTATQDTFLRVLQNVRSYKLMGAALDLYDSQGAIVVRLRAGTLVPKEPPV